MANDERRTDPTHPVQRPRLEERLAELAGTTPRLLELSEEEVRRHVAAFRSFLDDELLPQADAEEVELLPVLHRLGRDSLGAALASEHDTLRDAVRSLDGLARQPLTEETGRAGAQTVSRPDAAVYPPSRPG